MVITVLLLAGAIGWFSSSPLFWILAWPGTVIHELMHWIIGLITFAKPLNINIMPSPPGDGSRVLGSVEFANVGWWNALPVGLAPLLAFPLALGFAATMQFDWSLSSLLITWILASVISQCWPSPGDWQIAFSKPVGVLMWVGLVFYIFQ